MFFINMGFLCCVVRYPRNVYPTTNRVALRNILPAVDGEVIINSLIFLLFFDSQQSLSLRHSNISECILFIYSYK